MQSDVLKMPPHSIEAEQSVLGGLMINPQAWDTVSDIVTENDFYRRDHRLIYSAITRVVADQSPIDVITVMEKLKASDELEAAGGGEYLGGLARNTPSATNSTAYAKVVREKSVERQLMQAGTSIGGLAWEDLPVDEKIDRAGQLISELSSTKPATRTMKDILTESVNALDQRFHSKGPTGLQTGFNDLDEMLNGMQPSDLIIIAGRPSMGKTTFAMNIAENVSVKHDKATQVFSMEMSDVQLVDRSQCSIGRVDFSRHRSGKMQDEDWSRLTGAIGQLNEARITIDDTPALTVAQLRSRARRTKREHGLDLIIVDYIQLMRGEGENRTNEISSISRGLKALAKELDVPVIALSQLNRGLEQRQNKRPILSDLRESGSIEQDADVVIFLYRDEVYDEDTHLKGMAEAIIRKQRQGPTGTVNLTFLGQYCRFENYFGDPPEPPLRAVAGFKYAE